MKVQVYAAELIGTFALTFGVLVSLSAAFPVPTPVVAGLVLALFVYAIGDISGSHINPAVTIGLWGSKAIEAADAWRYIVAQLIGAWLAGFLHLQLFGPRPVLTVIDSLPVALGEMLGAFVLVFIISAFVAGNIEKSASGLAIGGALLLGILLAVPLSNAVLNPAVAIGIGSVSLPDQIAPLVAGWLGAWVYQWLQKS